MSAFAARQKLLARYKTNSEDDIKSDQAAAPPPAGLGSSGTEPKRRTTPTARGIQNGDEASKGESTPSQRKRRRVASKEKSAATSVSESEAGQAAVKQTQKKSLPSRSRTPPLRDNGHAAATTELSLGADMDLEADRNIETPGVDTTSLGLAADHLIDASALRLTLQNCCTHKENGILELRIDSHERLKVPIIGQYGIRILRGEALIAGATLRPSSDVTWVQAPLCYSVPVLRCVESSIVELHPHPSSSGFRKLGRLSPHYRAIWNRTQPSGMSGGSSFRIVCGPEDLPKRSVLRGLYSPPEWNKKLAEISTNGAKSMPCFICGPKGSGKSTFARLLTNRLLTSQTGSASGRTRSSARMNGVVILDVDPGQSEFCPPGTLSLVLVQKPNLAPPFAHPWPDDTSATLIRCHFLASVNPGSDTDLFMESALDLYSHYKQRYNGYPLVVNTPGWILGTGLDLLSLLINSIKPAEVVYMSEDGPTETVEGLESACRSASFTTLPSQQSDPSARRSAAHLRAMQTMAYFHSVKKDSPHRHLSVDTLPLSAKAPWRVSYAGKNRGIAGILCYGAQLESTLLAQAINGMVLAAVEVEDERAFKGQNAVSEQDIAMDLDAPGSDKILEQINAMVRTTPEGIPYIHQVEGSTLDPRYSHTLGLVLIRGIDVNSSALQVLTPIPRTTIEQVRQNGRHIVFVHGQLDAPTWAYTEDLYDGTNEVEDDVAAEESGEDGGVVTGGVGGRPWVEGVDGTRRRQVGGGTWRVRRDLGRQQPK